LLSAPHCLFSADRRRQTTAARYKCNRVANAKALNPPHLLEKIVPTILKCRILREIQSELPKKAQILRLARLLRHDNLFGRIARDSEGGIEKSELGFEADENWRENATTFCGGIRPHGHFRFLDFGYPPPLLFSAAYKTSCNFCLSEWQLPRIIPTGLAFCSRR
jgi:hypothetical protein